MYTYIYICTYVHKLKTTDLSRASRYYSLRIRFIIFGRNITRNGDDCYARGYRSFREPINFGTNVNTRVPDKYVAPVFTNVCPTRRRSRRDFRKLLTPLPIQPGLLGTKKMFPREPFYRINERTIRFRKNDEKTFFSFFFLNKPTRHFHLYVLPRKPYNVELSYTARARPNKNKRRFFERVARRLIIYFHISPPSS